MAEKQKSEKSKYYYNDNLQPSKFVARQACRCGHLRWQHRAYHSNCLVIGCACLEFDYNLQKTRDEDATQEKQQE